MIFSNVVHFDRKDQYTEAVQADHHLRMDALRAVIRDAVGPSAADGAADGASNLKKLIWVVLFACFHCTVDPVFLTTFMPSSTIVHEYVLELI